MPQPAPAGVQTLIGPMSSGSATGGVNIAAAVQGASQQLRDLIAGIDAVARQFPETSEPASAAKMALVEMMQAIVGAQRGPESVAPPPVMG
jgi:alpha-D-ribose 1-methylphosphonate 5-phosphate C-P lyase